MKGLIMEAGAGGPQGMCSSLGPQGPSSRPWPEGKGGRGPGGQSHPESTRRKPWYHSAGPKLLEHSSSLYPHKTYKALQTASVYVTYIYQYLPCQTEN